MSPAAGSTKLYACTNPACSLGVAGQPGYFTGGLTVEGMNVLTGKPEDSAVEGEDYGSGVCPNCGQTGEEAGMHKSVEGEDTDG